MNAREPSPGGPSMPDFRSAANIFALILFILAVSTEVFLRKGFGPRYFGLQSALAALAIPFFTIFFPHDDPRPLMWFLMAYLGMCLLCRIGTMACTARGLHCHSRYNGRPLLCRVLPWMSEVAIKRSVEPAVVLVAGLLIAEWNLPLGSYLMLSAFGLAATAFLIEAHERQRSMDMLDGYLDQTVIAERFRQMRGIRQLR
jgi:hypothetical protein